MVLCPACCRDHAHRLRSTSGAMLWRPGLVASVAWLDYLARRMAWETGAVMPSLRTMPRRPPEDRWLVPCPACDGTGLAHGANGVE